MRTYDRGVAAKQIIAARIYRAASSVITLRVGFARDWGIGYATEAAGDQYARNDDPKEFAAT